MELYDYQAKLLGELSSSISKGYQRLCCISPTGSGKTVMIREFIRSLNDKYYTCFIVPNRVLVEQSAKAYDQIDLNFGKLHGTSEFKEDFLNWITTIQTIMARYDPRKAKAAGKEEPWRPPFRVFVLDECHHAKASTYEMLIRHMYPDALVVGFTATPARLDNLGLGAMIDGFRAFDYPIFGPSVSDLIQRGMDGKKGALSQFRYIKPKTNFAYDAEVKRLLKQHDFKSIEDAMSNGVVIGDVIKQYKKYGWEQRLKGLLFAPTRQSGKQYCYEYNKAGIPSEYLDGDTSARERRAIMSKYQYGEILMLMSCDTISEGFDVPECAIVQKCRPTESISLNFQQDGRVLRYRPNKMAYIIDHVDNYSTFGDPASMTQEEWRDFFYGKIKERDVETYTCSNHMCRSCFDPKTYTSCPFCGTPVSHKPKTANSKKNKKVEACENSIFTGLDVEMEEVQGKPKQKSINQNEAFELLNSEFMACNSEDQVRKVLEDNGLSVKLSKMFLRMVIDEKMKGLKL